MAAGRIMVGPVDHATLGVPFVLAEKTHLIAFAQAVDARGQVDIVRHQQRQSIVGAPDETLVAAALEVITQ
ncbi:hypothetical protein D3C80_2173130 [compost metagenome]